MIMAGELVGWLIACVLMLAGWLAVLYFRSR